MEKQPRHRPKREFPDAERIIVSVIWKNVPIVGRDWKTECRGICARKCKRCRVRNSWQERVKHVQIQAVRALGRITTPVEYC